MKAYRAWAIGDSNEVLTSRISSLQPFIATLHLFLTLRALGVPIDTATVRRTLRTRLWILFGPLPGRKKVNLIAAARRPFNLVDVVQIAQQVWPGGIFKFDDHGLLERLEQQKASQKGQTQDWSDMVILVQTVFGESNYAGWKPGPNERLHYFPDERKTYLLGRGRIQTRSWIRYLIKTHKLKAVCLGCGRLPRKTPT